MMTNSKNEKEVIRALRAHYRSGDSDLGRDFFSPCLMSCTKYRRAVGYFSSTALQAWADALPRVVSTNQVKIQLLISPILSSEDIQALKATENEHERDKLRQIIADDLVSKAIDFANNPHDSSLRLRLFTWLVANEHLVLKFAYPKHVDNPGIYHEKIGVFDFPWGDRVAFVGSANETGFGHRNNYEVIHVYRSWISGDSERVEETSRDFEDAWEGNASGLRVISLSREVMNKIRERSQHDIGSNVYAVKEEKEGEERNKWRHQDEAVSRFLEAHHGVLEMATGTGKTRTSLKILTALQEKGLLDGVIVTTDGTDLLDQWYQELLVWGNGQKHGYRVLRNYGGHHQLHSFALNPESAVLVISRQQLLKLFKSLNKDLRKKLAIIHDEVHGLGSSENQRSLSGEHKYFGYTLGLSATPDREYDEEGTKFITNEIGPVIYKFDLKNAIERGILCEFDYVALPYELTDEDKRRLQQVFSRAAKREKQGNPMSKEEKWIEISKVYKTAEKKPEVFADYLEGNPDIIRHSIIFVDNREYGERILPILHQYTHLYRTYYAEDDKNNLLEFSKGNIDCLITCHKLSQGIDISHIKNVILFSSARAKLETIQRIGRCLRVDPNDPGKRAMVIDFVRDDISDDAIDSADADRYEWLSDLSKTKRVE